MITQRTLRILFCCLLLYSVNCLSDRIAAVLDNKEKLAQRIAQRAAELYESRDEAVANCSCSMHTCAFETGQRQCHTELGTPDVCGNDACSGQNLDYNSSVVNTPPGANLSSLSSELKESICTYKGLESSFKELYPNVFLWTYMATPDGHFRLFPAVGRDHTQEENVEVHGCRDYDPRGRPWYIAASTGPKDIVFVIDGSGSMLNDPPIAGLPLKWNTTKNAVLSMLNTLSTGDFTNIVVFSDTARQLWTRSNLVVASTENKEEMKRLLDGVTPDGGTNFDAAFELAFNLLTNACSAEEETCSNCEKVIIFLTDGKDTSRSDGGIKPSEMTAKIAGYQGKLESALSKRASIFTFSFGHDADDSIPRQIACNNDGSWAFIDDSEDPLTAMRSYYLFLATKRSSGQSIWSEPYLDDLGLGMVTTVATPIYSKGNDNLTKIFLGVASHDTLLSELGDSEKERNDVIVELIKRARRCTPTVTDACQFQVLRNIKDKASTCIDRFPIKSIPPSEPDAPQCFTNGRSFYKRYSSLVSWDEARNRCIEDGGALVSVGSPEELAFVANMASDDGTWIGARRQLDTFAWLDTSSFVLDDNSEAWGIDQPDSDGGLENCVSIDTRGPTGNLNDANCADELSFICAYKTNASCKGDVLNPINAPRGYFTVPPVESCIQAAGSLAHVQSSRAAAAKASSEVLCPFGPWKSDIDLQCCSECHSDTNSDETSSKDEKRVCLSPLEAAFISLAFGIGGVMAGCMVCFVNKRRNAPKPKPKPSNGVPPRRSSNNIEVIYEGHDSSDFNATLSTAPSSSTHQT